MKKYVYFSLVILSYSLITYTREITTQPKGAPSWIPQNASKVEHVRMPFPIDDRKDTQQAPWRRHGRRFKKRKLNKKEKIEMMSIDTLPDSASNSPEGTEFGESN